jgi:hypothetical protein
MFGFTDSVSQTTVNTTTFSNLCTTSYCDKARNGTSDPATATLTNSDLPSWLQSADAARAFLTDLQTQATAEGRYFDNRTTATSPSLGSSTNPQFTFVDGNFSATGNGAGLLVVTGNMTFVGDFTFDGVVLVLGSWKDSLGTLQGGNLSRSGGGNCLISGALVVSHFDRTTNTGFLPTSFDTSGGGTSDIKFNSLSVANALNSLGSRVVGVTEF